MRDADTDLSYFRWRNTFVGAKVDQLKQLRVIASIENPVVIGKVLEHREKIALVKLGGGGSAAPVRVWRHAPRGGLPGGALNDLSSLLYGVFCTFGAFIM